MTGFELMSSGISSNRTVNCATTTALKWWVWMLNRNVLLFLGQMFNHFQLARVNWQVTGWDSVGIWKMFSVGTFLWPEMDVPTSCNTPTYTYLAEPWEIISKPGRIVNKYVLIGLTYVSSSMAKHCKQRSCPRTLRNIEKILI